MGDIKFISHRGNLRGPDTSRENSPDYIDEAIKAGFQVEVDLRAVGCHYYLGHDYAQYKVDDRWVFDREDNLLLHVKDLHALKMCHPSWHVFCHAGDAFTITSQRYIWLHDLSLVPNERTIVPLMTQRLIESFPRYNMHAICSDYETDRFGNLYSGHNVPRGT